MRLWREYHVSYAFCTQAGNSAAADYRYRGKSRVACPEEVMTLEPGELHAVHRVYGLGHFDVVFIDPSLVKQLLGELKLPNAALHWRSSQTVGLDLLAVFRRFHASVAVTASALERQSRLVVALRLLAERNAERVPGRVIGGTESAALTRARDLIVDGFAENFTLDDIAACAGLRYFDLIRKFRERFGMPPHAFQLQVRLARARSLLAQGIPPVHAAAHTGFADQSHLNRHFRRTFSVTPAQYARGVPATL